MVGGKVRVLECSYDTQKNGRIEFRCTSSDIEHEFSLKVDGEIIPLGVQPLNASDFLLYTNFKGDFRNLELFTIHDSDWIQIAKYENNRLTRFIALVKKWISEKLQMIRNYFQLFKKGIWILWKRHKFIVPINMWVQYLKALKLRFLSKGSHPFYFVENIDHYNRWIEANNQKEVLLDLMYRPKISFIVPVYNVEPIYLKECIESVLRQTYENVEICLVDDASTNLETKKVLEEYSVNEKVKVRYRSKNGHISIASNDALEMSSGDFIGLLDNDDTLTYDACYQIVKVLNKNRDIDFIYSDEDKLELSGLFSEPHFKPDYSPDTLLSLNYISHLTVIRKEIIEQVGGFTIGLEGSQDYDLYLKILEITSKVYHIPKVLYHWRKVPGSTADILENKVYAIDSGKIAIQNHLDRIGVKGEVFKDPRTSYYHVQYALDMEPSISIVIPTKDQNVLLKNCLESIYSLTSYSNFEVIIIDNNSEKDETFKLFEEYRVKYRNFRVIEDSSEFNYSKLNNHAVMQCESEFILLLNNDTKVLEPNWLSVMVGYASQKHIGAVGAKLLYEDETVQHCGVVLGIGGAASHVYLNASKFDNGLYGRLSVPYNYAAVTGACLMVSRAKYNEVFGLNEELKVAYNDIDFCLKLIEKGYYNIVVPQVCLFHYESKSRGYDSTLEKYNRFRKESKYMHDKWESLIQKDPFYNSNFSLNGWFVLNKESKRN